MMPCLDTGLVSDSDGGTSLLCPACGSNYLHHGRVEVFCREQEDSKTGKHVTVEPNGWVNTDKALANNPSKRRDGMLIHFECEECDVKTVLAVYQHKGATFLASGFATESIKYDLGK